MEPINMTASDYAWSLIDHCAIPIVGQTLCGDVVTWNSAAEQLFGYRPKEILGRSALLLVPPDRLQEQEELFAAIGAGEVVTEFDTVRLRVDGISIPVTLTLSPVRDWSSRIIESSRAIRVAKPGRSERCTARVIHLPMSSIARGYSAPWRLTPSREAQQRSSARWTSARYFSSIWMASSESMILRVIKPGTRS
jgi:PAS domain S-box-containing protein